MILNIVQRKEVIYVVFKQITAVSLGDKYDNMIFALDESGEIYALRIHANTITGENGWVKLTKKFVRLDYKEESK